MVGAHLAEKQMKDMKGCNAEFRVLLVAVFHSRFPCPLHSKLSRFHRFSCGASVKRPFLQQVVVIIGM